MQNSLKISEPEATKTVPVDLYGSLILTAAGHQAFWNTQQQHMLQSFQVCSWLAWRHAPSKIPQNFTILTDYRNKSTNCYMWNKLPTNLTDKSRIQPKANTTALCVQKLITIIIIILVVIIRLPMSQRCVTFAIRYDHAIIFLMLWLVLVIGLHFKAIS